MQIKITFFLFLFLLLMGNLSAQKAIIEGTIIDKNNSELIPFATISVINSQNKQFGGYSDPKGNFKIENLETGDYEILISFVGYETLKKSNLKIDKSNTKLNLGVIALINNSIALQTVEVSAMQKTLVNKIDRQTYRAADFSTAKGGTAADILGKLPSVAIDPDGTVSVRGSSDFAVYLNGKPTQMDASVLLSQLSADQIENIEIISVPTSKFDAQGKGGIINVTTKRTGAQGLSVSANGLIGGSPWGNKTDVFSNYKMNDNRAGAGLNFVFMKDKLSLYGGFNFNNRQVNGSRDGDARILVNATNNTYKHMIAAGERPEWYKYMTASLGFDYQLTKKSNLSASYFHGNRTDARSAFYIYNNFYADKNKVTIAGVDRKEEWIYNPNTDSRVGAFNTANVDFAHKFDNKSDLKISLLYEFSDFSRELSNENFAFNNLTRKIGAKQLEFKQTDDTPLEGVRLSVDYSKELKNGHKLGVGFQPQYFSIEGGFNYDTLNIVSDNLLPYNALQNNIELQRAIYAGYVDYTGNIGKLNFIAGLRAEYTDQQVDILSPNYFSILYAGSDKKSQYQVDKLDLFHSVLLSYKLSDKDKLSFASSRRINRPALKNMTPFLYRRHLEVYEVGDPTLKPEYLSNFEMTFEKNIGKQNFSIVGFYRGVDNAVFRVNTVTNEIPTQIANEIPEVTNLLKEEVLIRSYTNAGNSTSLGLELNANFDLASKFKIYVGGSLYNYNVKGDIFGYNVDNSSLNWSTKANINYFISKELKFTTDFNFRSATITAQGQNDLFYIANAAFSYAPKSLKGWDFSLKGLNLLGSNLEGLDTKAFNKNGAEIFYQITDYFRTGPIVELTASYSFNTKAKAKKATESSIGKEQF